MPAAAPVSTRSWCSAAGHEPLPARDHWERPAMFDYDGRPPDLFFVNGTTLQGFPKARTRGHLYRNRDGTRFEDVTVAAGLSEQWAGDRGPRRRLRQRRPRGSARHLLRPEPVVPQHRPRTLRRCHRGRRSHAITPAGIPARCSSTTTVTVCGSVRRQLHRSRPRHRADAESGLCRFKGAGCVRSTRPQGRREPPLPQLGNGRFGDVSERSGITHANGSYAR